jgi:hypothetical protein
VNASSVRRARNALSSESWRGASDEDGRALGVPAQEAAHLVLARHELRQHRAPVHHVHRVGAGPQPSFAQLHRPRIGQDAAHAVAAEGLLEDLLVGARLHVRPVDDGHGGGGRAAGRHAEHGVHEGRDRRWVLHLVGAGEVEEDRQALEQPGHPVAVAEAGRGIAVDLDEAGARGAQEGIDAGEHDVRRAGVEEDPRHLRLRRGEIGAETGGVAVERAAGHPRRQLEQRARVVAQPGPLPPAHEVRPQERAHRQPRERDAGLAEGLFQRRRLAERRRLVRGEEGVVIRYRPLRPLLAGRRLPLRPLRIYLVLSRRPGPPRSSSPPLP